MSEVAESGTPPPVEPGWKHWVHGLRLLLTDPEQFFATLSQPVGYESALQSLAVISLVSIVTFSCATLIGLTHAPQKHRVATAFMQALLIPIVTIGEVAFLAGSVHIVAKVAGGAGSFQASLAIAVFSLFMTPLNCLVYLSPTLITLVLGCWHLYLLSVGMVQLHRVEARSVAPGLVVIAFVSAFLMMLALGTKTLPTPSELYGGAVVGKGN